MSNTIKSVSLVINIDERETQEFMRLVRDLRTTPQELLRNLVRLHNATGFVWEGMPHPTRPEEFGKPGGVNHPKVSITRLGRSRSHDYPIHDIYLGKPVFVAHQCHLAAPLCATAVNASGEMFYVQTMHDYSVARMFQGYLPDYRWVEVQRRNYMMQRKPPANLYVEMEAAAAALTVEDGDGN